jgi:DNA-binding transcriptional MerR regulator
VFIKNIIMPLYGQGRLAEIVDWKASNIAYYVNAGVIEPEEPGEGGRGHHNRYGDRNVAECKILKGLSRYGVPLNTVRLIMDKIRKEAPEILTPKVRCFLLLRNQGEKILIHPVAYNYRMDDKKPLVCVGDVKNADSAMIITLV